MVKGIFEFFENMDEFVYAADVETQELVYMNKKTLAEYGFASVADIKGKKCYEVLQQISIPCGMCNNAELCVGKFAEWNYYNPVIDKYLMLKDTLIEDEETGKKYRIEIAVDVSRENEQKKLFKKQQSIERLINEILRTALNESDPDVSIAVILEQLGRSLSGQRTYIFEKNPCGGDDNTYEWTAEGVSQEIENLQGLAADVCAEWYASFQEGKNIIFGDIEEVRSENPVRYEILKRQGIHSLVVVPLYNDGKAIGFYGVDNPPKDTLEYISNMLQVMSYFLVSCIKRRNLIRRLEGMSYKDSLTKLGNRFAMDDYVQNIDAEKSMGVVYCDITGLKYVNDTLGHAEGDCLILRATECLKKAFQGYGLFRIGGDEFLALCTGITEVQLKDCIARLREYMKENRVNMAIGEIWLEKAESKLDALLKESEKLMYADKDAYYKKSGVERRKGNV